MNSTIIVKGNGQSDARQVVVDAGYSTLPLCEDPHQEFFEKDGIRYRFGSPVWVWDGKRSSKLRDVRIRPVSVTGSVPTALPCTA